MAYLPFFAMLLWCRQKGSESWMFCTGVFCKEGCELTGTNPQCSSYSLLQSPIPFFRLCLFEIWVESCVFVPSRQAYTLSSSFPFGYLQLSPPSCSPSVSLHISLGLVPLIKHSCCAHGRPLFLFFTLLYKLAGHLSQTLAPLTLGDVTDGCLYLGHKTNSAVSSDCWRLFILPVQKYVHVCHYMCIYCVHQNKNYKLLHHSYNVIITD